MAAQTGEKTVKSSSV